MDFKLRTILVGLISLAAVLAIYQLYNRVSKTPQIDIDTIGQFTNTRAESNAGNFDDEIGEIGDVGIAALTKPVFQHLKNGQVDREFGFEELLHEVKDEWEVEKPYINIYQPNFNCFVTADRGTVQVETAVGRPSLGDATFVGNVVIHILPQSGSDIRENFIYLEDVVFVREKSLFSTAGPVRVVSQDAQMLGTGLELVYNDQLERLEYFRIIHLESLRLKSSQTGLFSDNRQHKRRSAKMLELSSAKTEAKRRQAIERKAGEYYRCILSKNVVIDAPDQLVFAQDSVSINNIFWSRVPDDKSYPEQQGAKEEGRATNDQCPKRKRRLSANERRATEEEQSGDIVVTCDHDVVLVPVNSTRERNNSGTFSVEAALPHKKHPESSVDFAGRTTFVTRRIDYDVSSGDCLAPGPSELTFYTQTLADAESEKAAIPVKITAQKETKFLSASNQVIFEGDCICTMLRTEPNNVQQKYTLTAPMVTINFESPATSQGSYVGHLTADGGVVKLRSIKTAKGQLLGGVELECRKVDYDAGQELFIATGPGQIRLNNSKISEPNEDLGRFSLRQPCYVFLRDFAVLKYFQKDNRIIADAAPGRTLWIDYFPIVGGEYGRQVVATATHADVSLVQTADGQTELSALTVSGAVTYTDKDKNNEFAGSDMFYDHKKAIIKIQGDESAPCYYNGTLVEGVEIDLKTGKVKAQIAGPGALQLK
ncbi:MAG: hypothetical protein ACE5NM_01350 [Sedimentisphaerales bacterium]